MLRSRLHALSAGLGAAALLGCSSSQPLAPDLAGAGASGGAFGGAAGSSAGGAAAQCPAPGYGGAAGRTQAQQIDEVDATLLDPSGTPVPNLAVQVCGLDACINGTTNAVGQTSVTPRQTLLRPAFKYGDGFGFAKLAALLGPGSTQDLGRLVALPLPSYADGAAFPGSGSVTSGEVTLILAPGTQLLHDLLTYSADSELVLRSVPIPLADSPRAADPGLGFELGYALAPVSTTFCPPAGLRVKNSLGWAAGSAVEVFIQGLEVDEKWAPYAGWVKVADASVSGDQVSIDSTSGGIPILSAIALRRK